MTTQDFESWRLHPPDTVEGRDLRAIPRKNVVFAWNTEQRHGLGPIQTYSPKSDRVVAVGYEDAALLSAELSTLGP